MTEHFTDHVTRGVERLIERYRLPRTSALLASWITEVQVLEDALIQLLVERSVDTAVGEQLDVLGKIVGQPKQGRDDETYRLWISARTLVSRSSGTTEEIIAIVKKLVGGATVRLDDYYPAAFTVSVLSGTDAVSGAQIAQLVQLAKAAGVQFFFVWQTDLWPDAFMFSPLLGVPVLDSPHGFDRGAFAFASDGTIEPTPENVVTYESEIVTDEGVAVLLIV